MNATKSLKTLIPAALVLAVTVYPGSEMALWGSFALVIVTVIFLPWSVYSMVRMVRRPVERRHRAMRVAVWAAVLVVAFGVRARWDAVAREQADAVASAVQAHKLRTGGYPANLGEVGLEAEALKARFGLRYRVSEGQAALFYARPSMPLVAHHYNFETSSWTRQD